MQKEVQSKLSVSDLVYTSSYFAMVFGIYMRFGTDIALMAGGSIIFFGMNWLAYKRAI